MFENQSELTLSGRIDRLQFDEGFCQALEYSGNPMQDDFFFYYYDRDHLGSIRQVVRADRALLPVRRAAVRRLHGQRSAVTKV